MEARVSSIDIEDQEHRLCASRRTPHNHGSHSERTHGLRIPETAIGTAKSAYTRAISGGVRQWRIGILDVDEGSRTENLAYQGDKIDRTHLPMTSLCEDIEKQLKPNDCGIMAPLVVGYLP